LKLGNLLVTSLQTYRVNGDSLQVRGLVPDIVIPTDRADLRQLREHESVATPSYDQIAPIDHANLARLIAEQKAELQAQSDRRRERSAAFQALVQKFEQSHAARTQKYASLNEQRAGKEARPSSSDDSSENVDGPLFQPDAVTDEVVAIAADYLNLLKGSR
jgi:carboxyl-terminal processing protease